MKIGSMIDKHLRQILKLKLFVEITKNYLLYSYLISIETKEDYYCYFLFAISTRTLSLHSLFLHSLLNVKLSE